MLLVNFCKSYGNQADVFYAANAWTPISDWEIEIHDYAHVMPVH